MRDLQHWFFRLLMPDVVFGVIGLVLVTASVVYFYSLLGNP